MKEINKILFACSMGLLMILGASFFSSCGNGGGHSSSVAADEYGASSFNSSDDLLQYVKQKYASDIVPWNYLGGLPGLIAACDPFPGDPPYSSTNTHETGVDEADQIKTDGRYFYVAGEKKVHVAEVIPAEDMQLATQIPVDGDVKALYLHDDYLVILYRPEGSGGETWNGTNSLLYGGNFSSHVETGMLLMNVSDPYYPQKLNDVRLEGFLISSRVVDGKLHIVQTYHAYLPDLQTIYNTEYEDKATIIANNMAKLSACTSEDLLPYFTRLDHSGGIVERYPLVPPQYVVSAQNNKGGSMVTVNSFDLKDVSNPHQSFGILADALNFYASARSIYLFKTRYDFPANMAEAFSTDYTTSIYKLDITGDAVSYAGGATLQGRVTDSLSFGESDDVLRVAVMSFGADFSNNLYCLRSEDEGFEVIGKLENLAPGEVIYSARFCGSRGYMVTFKQVDPLFTIDLSDPTDPKVEGELKVPGYSNYIHLYNENHLLTIGKDAVEENMGVYYQGLQLSLFDVSDITDPLLLYKEMIGDRGTHSEAIQNYKAFTYWPTSNLLAIPVKLCEHLVPPASAVEFGEPTFQGVYVYRVTPSYGFDYLGRIDTDSLNPDPGKVMPWTRGVFISEKIYSVQGHEVNAADWSDIQGGVDTLLLD